MLSRRAIGVGLALMTTMGCGAPAVTRGGAAQPKRSHARQHAHGNARRAFTSGCCASFDSSDDDNGTGSGPRCTSFDELQREFAQARPLRVLSGKATYYSDSLAGHAMASGEVYQPDCAQAAHRTLPFGSVARVRMVKSGDSVVVRITDRGPYAGKDRIIDLSYSAARHIGLVREGVADVRVEVLRVAK